MNCLHVTYRFATRQAGQFTHAGEAVLVVEFRVRGENSVLCASVSVDLITCVCSAQAESQVVK